MLFRFNKKRIQKRIYSDGKHNRRSALLSAPVALSKIATEMGKERETRHK
jgi:hypothetical protein